MNYSFAQPEYLIDFMFNAADSIDSVSPVNVFLEWEITSFYIESSNGLKISISTKIIDPTGATEYITWKKLKDLVKIYFDTNSLMGITIDIRMRLPKDLKLQLDPNSEYRSFNLSFFSQNDVTMAATTAVENSSSSSYKPVEKWTDYVSNIVNIWKLKKGVV